jgi:hypothetical protein
MVDNLPGPGFTFIVFVSVSTAHIFRLYFLNTGLT